MTDPIHHIIRNGRGRLVISEHRDSAFISSEVDGAGISGFYTPDQLLEMEGVIRNIRRRIQARAG